MTREEAIQCIIKENERRNAVIYAKFDPISGEGSVGKRKKVVIDDFPVSVQWLEKPRDFDPFGQTGLSPLATI